VAREADWVRLAKEAMHKLANEKRTSIPAPSAQVRAQRQKINKANENILRWWAHKDSNLGPAD
jgi:hypothetical protein